MNMPPRTPREHAAGDEATAEPEKPAPRRDPASFRDPSGFVFHHGKDLLRAVDESYRADYDHLMRSGLYAQLVEMGLLIEHLELPEGDAAAFGATGEALAGTYRILRPERLELISYPYEWSFHQLKDAALATLKIQALAFSKGMTLKDGSAYNIQFLRGRPLLIDTLSFARYEEGQLWAPYGQFCRHFLAPLLLMAHVDLRLGRLLQLDCDGIELDLASSLLPWRTRLHPGILSHLHLHAAMQRRYAGSGAAPAKTRRISPLGLRGLIDSLSSLIQKLERRRQKSEWADYYDHNTNYSAPAERSKRHLVGAFLALTEARTVWDLGANTGLYSRIAAAQGRQVISFDIDPNAVDLSYLRVKAEKEENVLPLLLDLKNPSPGIGWLGRERRSIFERANADAVLALALVHHLAIASNVPLGLIADLFAALGALLVIEFVPKEDSQVQRLLASRPDIFPDYHQAGFEQAFAARFELLRKEHIEGSERTLYLYRRRPFPSNQGRSAA